MNTETMPEKTLFGHPIGLRNLFFTEMWERMSYYGMRALLVLFMVAAIEDGGFGFTDQSATAIYGLYTAAVYLMTVLGGWIADRLIGARQCIWYGGIIITAGHFVLAIPSHSTFFLGLILVIMGTGLLKPNISSVVGMLYPPGDSRRDGGFTLFYMGINLGASLGPLLCGYLAESETFGWHYGFGAAGVGMLVGLIQYRLGQHNLGEHGLIAPYGQGKNNNLAWIAIGCFVALVLLMLSLLSNGVFSVDPVLLAKYATGFIGAIFIIYFIFIFVAGNLNQEENDQVKVIFIICLAATMFWSGFEQAGSSLTLFAEKFTDRMVGSFEVPASWFQSLNPFFIIVLAPVFSWLWVFLAARNLNPSTPLKFALGLIIMGLGFAVMIGASSIVINSNKALPIWLITTYLLHTMGELCLSPVGLSAVSKLSPKRYLGQMMGMWFLASSLGLIVAGLLAGEISSSGIEGMPGLYTQITVVVIASGLLLVLFVKPIKRWGRSIDDLEADAEVEKLKITEIDP